MQNSNSLLNALYHHPHDLTHENIADLRLWAMKRRYTSLAGGAGLSGLYLLQAYARHSPIHKLVAGAIAVAGYLYLHEVFWVGRMPNMREESKRLDSHHVLHFYKKVRMANGYMAEYSHAVDYIHPKFKWMHKTV